MSWMRALRADFAGGDSHPPQHPSPPLCHPRSLFLPLPLCGACPFVGYCGLFSINYFRKKICGHCGFLFSINYPYFRKKNKKKNLKYSKFLTQLLRRIKNSP